MSNVPSPSETFMKPRGNTLTDTQIAALTQPDYGVSQADGIPNYRTFDEWMTAGGVNGMDNFIFNFSDNFIAEGVRQGEHFQRFTRAHNNQFSVVNAIANEIMNGPDPFNQPRTEQEEYLFWNTYQVLAALVDKNDRMVTSVPNFAGSNDAKSYLTR